MTIKDLAPWNWGKKNLSVRSGEEHPFEQLQRQMNRLFDDFFSGLDLEPFSGWTERFGGFNPRVNVVEDDKEIRLTAELPGMDERDIDISLTKDALTIRGEKRDEREKNEEDNRYYSERIYGSFSRTIPLSCEIDEDKVDASFIKGVLNIKLPKSEAARKQSKKITVRS